jgi:hypothetical protein
MGLYKKFTTLLRLLYNIVRIFQREFIMLSNARKEHTVPARGSPLLVEEAMTRDCVPAC